MIRKPMKEKLRRATLRGHKAAKKQLRQEFDKEARSIKLFYVAKLREKNYEIRKLDKMVKKIEERAKWLDDFERILYMLYKKAAKNQYVEVEEISERYSLLEKSVGQLEIRQNRFNRKKQKIMDSVEDYEIERLKLAK
jgi:hypothetical protein